MRKKEWTRLAVAALAAFCVYTCMYAFRKPFTAAAFANLSFVGIEYKVWLVIAQTIGYTLSKFYGIRFIAELKNTRRSFIIIGFILVAWMALFFFAITPPPYNILFLLLNGFPLGVIYGLVFSYLEGRRSTELLGAVLASSFIFASGFTQSVGKYILLNWKVSEWWMPFVTGAVFLVPTVLFTLLLERTPAPTEEDKTLRTVRVPMSHKDRRKFIQSFLPGLVLLIGVYVLLTIIRDYRSNFAANIWTELGQGSNAAVFTQTEIPACLVTLFLLSLLILVKNNFKALLLNHYIVVAGFLFCIAATLLYRKGIMSPFWWMTITGVGLYMGYVPFNAMLFERLIAAFKTASNAGFLIYLADSFGYLGSDGILVMKNFLHLPISSTDFFAYLLLTFSVLGIFLTPWSILYFRSQFAYRIKQKSRLAYG